MRFAVFVAVAMAVANAPAAEPKSLCDIAELLYAYDGETVILRGNILVDLKRQVFALGENCLDEQRRSNLIHLEIRGAPSSVVDAASRLKAQFQTVQDHGKVIKAIATVSGRMEVTPPETSRRASEPRTALPPNCLLPASRISRSPRFPIQKNSR